MVTEQLIAELRTNLVQQLRRARALRELPLVLLEQRPALKKWSVLET